MWLVLHGVFTLDANAVAVADTSNIGILVTCLGETGAPLLHGSQFLERWLATHAAVTEWINRYGKRGGKKPKHSRVLSTIDIEKKRVVTIVMPEEVEETGSL